MVCCGHGHMVVGFTDIDAFLKSILSLAYRL